MKLNKSRYRFLVLLLMLAILPSMIGVHVFKHFCNGCEESNVVTTLITTEHSHSHDCAGCECASSCHDCYDASGAHRHHDESNCEHKYAIVDFDGQTAVINFSFVAVQFDLLYSSELIADLQSDNINDKYKLYNVIQSIPDKPLPEKNCVFLL